MVSVCVRERGSEYWSLSLVKGRIIKNAVEERKRKRRHHLIELEMITKQRRETRWKE